MNCRQVRNIIPELVSGKLYIKTLQEATAHICNCEQCKMEITKYKSVLGALENYWTPAQVPSSLDSFAYPHMSERKHLNLKPMLGWMCTVLAVIAVISLAYIYKNMPGISPIVQQALTNNPNSKQIHVDIQINAQVHQSKQPVVEKNTKPKHKPAIQDEKQEQRQQQDEHKAKPHKRWTNYASTGVTYIRISSATKKQGSKTAMAQPVNGQIDAVYSYSEPASEPVKPSTEKPTYIITRQIVTYDINGDKRITLTEEETQVKPNEMALY